MALVVWNEGAWEVLEKVYLEWLGWLVVVVKVADAGGACHRRRWKRGHEAHEVEVWGVMGKDGGAVSRLGQCGSSIGCGDLPECLWLAAGGAEVAPGLS